MKIAKLLLYFNTVKHLRLKQFVFNFIRRFPAKLKIVDISDVECFQLTLIAPIKYKNKINNESVCFLNETRSFDYISDWVCLNEPKLWRYNLHYFDFLLDDGASEAVKDKLINEWISVSHNLKEDAWEPYPISLRLVNWVKYFIVYKNNTVPAHWLNSLYQQTQVFSNSIEYHILANHYLKNAKALFFAGAYLKTNDSKKWFDKGKKVLIEEAKEQILDDGGHYEKSPMYHSIMVEDYLDVINLLNSNSLEISADAVGFLKQQTIKSLGFLAKILMPDGDIPLFNDSAFKIAPHPDLIFKYADDLLEYKRKDAFQDDGVVSLDASGYYIIKSNNSQCIIDCGSISPDYQPGHTHCDLLSYELSVGVKRLIVNSGLFDYESSDEREYCRSTRAHNTIQVDDKEQSEVWGQFRVARRAKVINSDLYMKDNVSVFKGSYSPYWSSKSAIVHSRDIRKRQDVWLIKDHVSGSGNHVVKSYLHLHPDCNCQVNDGEYNLFMGKIKLAKITFSDNVETSVSESWYYPEFGVRQKNILIILTYVGQLPVKLENRITILN